jgi:hypothetical protein
VSFATFAVDDDLIRIGNGPEKRVANRATYGYHATDDHESKRHAIDGRTECPKQTHRNGTSEHPRGHLFQKFNKTFENGHARVGHGKMKKIIILCCAVALVLAGALVLSHSRKARTSKRYACIGNLRMIDSAKEQYAMQQDLTNGANVSIDQMLIYFPPRWSADFILNHYCPAGGQYTINPVGTDPECSAEGHGL